MTPRTFQTGSYRYALSYTLSLIIGGHANVDMTASITMYNCASHSIICRGSLSVVTALFVANGELNTM
ncbi:hypothetical protein [Bacillus massilioanorexius]|uniref:hypothetical protein n=1 Tax=Bacillus massilioanorexius TaxID=1468413 RepID=UPI0011DDA2F9|nr:hypothetical protein [Bacillus massilioanorexius]